MECTLKSVVYIFCVFYFVNSAVVPVQEEPELILVNVIFRHGARTTYAFYPNDPYKNETFYPFGYGGLTNEGKLGEYKLGRYLKSLYGQFLGEDYTEDKVYVRSTDTTRTKMSAQLVLAGLFPPSKIQRWNDELMWQPIPFSYKIKDEEDLIHPKESCPYKLHIYSELPELEEVQEIYVKPHKDTFTYIQENSGKVIKSPEDMQDFFFILKTESDMGYALPEWTKSIFPEPTESTAARVYKYHNHNPRVKQINAGYLLKKILDDSKTKIDGKTSKKIFLYSGHETTLGYMLDALDVYETHIPAYGSALSFEIYRVGDQHYMKMRYRNDTEATEPVDLTLPGCSVLCPFDKFVDLQKDLIPTVSVKDACNMDVPSLEKVGNQLK